MLRKKSVLKNFANSIGEHLCRSLFSEVAGLEAIACNFIKKRLRSRCLPMNPANLFRIAFLQNTSGRLPLLISVKANRFWGGSKAATRGTLKKDFLKCIAKFTGGFL